MSDSNSHKAPNGQGSGDHGHGHRHSRRQNGNDYKALNNDISPMERQARSGKKVNANSRKNQISINHLLDFQSYRDSPEYQKSQRPRQRRRSSNGPKKQHLFLHGMRFINVNYKFVLDYRKNYNVQQIDPNVPVDTDDILRIIVPKGNACPICLSEDLTAPRMITSCGHILCLTCLLSLLESEVPASMKKESKVIVEKYKDCPLCGSIIRQKDVKPVKIDNVDERFEVPKIKDEVVLTLMSRQPHRVFPLPRNFEELQETIDTFPWAAQQDPDLSQYSRFFKGDLAYLVSMYEAEREQIKAAYEEEKELYQDDGKYMRMALKNIDDDLALWSSKFNTDLPENAKAHQANKSNGHGSTFYYYQTGFKSSTVYVLSPLDIKVLKSSYNNDYAQLPSSLIAQVENIRYEELSAETALTKYKYLSHLPQGTSIGFLECKWQNNEYISKETWNTFKGDLTKRSKQSSKKFHSEESKRRRALNDEERRTREFFNRENNPHEEHDWMPPANFGSLSISDYRDLPALSAESQDLESSPEEQEQQEAQRLQRTVWGTSIPHSEIQSLEGEESWDAEEMIRKAREEMERQEASDTGKKKKKKKKLILLSST
ncbi:hypothetical protein CA3LBN_002355 [Candidozyma haemuli]|uniref:RING-type domain-containing protein n=1 Tax=Candidozyma haemuli TaxID=45357 RepID=A0ABX8I614_9ASCO|nr:hypothetical protein CA3LBN_002355 [[Candida] haemuloni]